ncbi:MAG: hypothetical protein FD147_2284 [Chloroflexi bacterium]|nr:MAG: hypothetical protein FD147_2284 [Chloroflexota bacterium]
MSENIKGEQTSDQTVGKILNWDAYLHPLILAISEVKITSFSNASCEKDFIIRTGDSFVLYQQLTGGVTEQERRHSQRMIPGFWYPPNLLSRITEKNIFVNQ